MATRNAVALITPLRGEEARALIKRIRKRLTESAADVARFYQGKGWEALGYPTWKACVEAEFGMAYTYANFLVRAHLSQVQLAELVPEEALPTVIQAGMMSAITDPSERAALWEQTAAEHEGKPTIEEVKTAVKFYRVVAKDENNSSPGQAVVRGALADPVYAERLQEVANLQRTRAQARQELAPYFDLQRAWSALRQIEPERAYTQWQWLDPRPLRPMSVELRWLAEYIAGYADEMAAREEVPLVLVGAEGSSS